MAQNADLRPVFLEAVATPDVVHTLLGYVRPLEDGQPRPSYLVTNAMGVLNRLCCEPRVASLIAQSHLMPVLEVRCEAHPPAVRSHSSGVRSHCARVARQRQHALDGFGSAGGSSSVCSTRRCRRGTGRVRLGRTLDACHGGAARVGWRSAVPRARVHARLPRAHGGRVLACRQRPGAAVCVRARRTHLS